MTEAAKEKNLSLGLEDVPVCRSKIGFIDGDKGILEYRGYSIQDLCKNSTFEETTYLLLFGELPNKTQLADFIKQLKSHETLEPEIQEIIKVLPKKGHPMPMLQAVTAAMSMIYPKHNLKDAEINKQGMLKIIAKVPLMMTYFDHFRKGTKFIEPDPSLSFAANFLYMLNGKKPNETETKIFDVCLILHADHTLNASTFSARVTASTLNDPYTSTSSAIGTLYGPLHGGANEKVLQMLESIGGAQNARKYVEDKLAKKEKIMGVGHRVYTTKDPRAIALQGIAEKLFAGKKNPLLDTAFEVEKVVKEKLSAKGIYPNVDFYSGLVYQVLGFSTDLFTPIFAAARTAGWLAHWLEQISDNRLLRPDQIYEGSPPRSYIPMDQRK